MKPREIREKIPDEVKNNLKAAEENLRTLRFQLVTSQLEKTSQIRITKREIARLKTALRENELGIRKLGVSVQAAE